MPGTCMLKVLEAADTLASLMVVVFVVLASVSAALGQQQPIGFSHRTHVEKARMQCADCHEGASSRDVAGIPSIRKCMLCHQFIGKDLPEIVRLAEYWERKHEVPWVRVYGFKQDASVQFRHAPHARAEIECQRCHGDVGSMTVASKVVRHTMGTCIECHRENQASDDCLVCHF